MKLLNFLIGWFNFLLCYYRLNVTNTDSTQMAIINDVGFTQLQTQDLHGRQRMAYFSFSTLAAGGADGDSYNLTKIPKGARILGIFTVNAALGAGVVSKIGITGNLTKYGSAVDYAAAGFDFYCQTVATYGLTTTAEETLIMTLTGAAPTAAAAIAGHVTYVVD